MDLHLHVRSQPSLLLLHTHQPGHPQWSSSTFTFAQTGSCSSVVVIDRNRVVRWKRTGIHRQLTRRKRTGHVTDACPLDGKRKDIERVCIRFGAIDTCSQDGKRTHIGRAYGDPLSQRRPYGLPPDIEITDSLRGPDIICFCHASESLRPHFERFVSDVNRRDERPQACIIADVFFEWTIEVARESDVFLCTITTCGAYGTAAVCSLWQHLLHVEMDSQTATGSGGHRCPSICAPLMAMTRGRPSSGGTSCSLCSSTSCSATRWRS
ncbi:hypothetical protein Taro_021529 [Colocasia esculenta]|uniref:Uncharacterized protein n=1 Tax=Colocasia esculenta TaxID=4460 RepID=A0A843UZB9_COLES|nr:hypothetical protein [Colocasia esculenta]